MTRFRAFLLTAVPLLSAALIAALPNPGDAQTVNHLVISEVLYDPLPPSAESDLEWVEIYNPTGAAIALAGWRLQDNFAQDLIPSFTLDSGAFLVVAANETAFRSRYPDFAGNMIGLGSPIGNGLSNTGDRVLLLDDRGNAVDTLSYGSDTTAFDPACPRVAEGQSLARVPPSQDTDAAADWVAQSSPSPGEAGAPPTATPTMTSARTASPSVTASFTPTSIASPSASSTAVPTATPTATASATTTATTIASATATPTGSLTPTATSTVTSTPTQAPSATSTSTAFVAAAIRLNEFLPHPSQIDWNGDGEINTGDEWIEIVNLELAPIDLGGWMLDDIAGGGSAPYTFPAGTLLLPQSFLFRFGATTKLALNDAGDTVRLLAPDGAEVDSYTYRASHADRSISRSADGVGVWTDTYPPSPGQPNRPPTPTLTPSPTATPTATVTPSNAFPGAVIITEIMQNPQAVADTSGEWFELYNATDTDIDLNGWVMHDLGSDTHRIQSGGPLWLPAHDYLVLGRNADAATNGGVSIAYQYKDFALGNSDDEIILENALGAAIDQVVYSPALGFPDPNGGSMALISPERDNAAGSNWRASFTAWPGGAGDLGSPGAANPIPPAQIEGYVFEDGNSNRHRDRDETGIEGVWLTLNTGARTHTDRDGWYGFYGLAAGTYVVTEIQPDGYISTMPDLLTITVAAAEISVGHDFGELRLSTSTPSPSPTAAPGTQPKLLLSEVFYDAPQTGTDSDFEWVEVFNPTAGAVDVAGWKLRDNTTEDVIPAFLLAPGEYLVIAATATGFAANNPDYTGHLVSLAGSIGGGLGNTGDRVLLLAPDGAIVDAMSYGSDAGVFDPPCPSAPVGGSLARLPSTQDTDTAADWTVQRVPNPGAAAPTPTATPTSTATSPRSPTPSATNLPTPTPTPSPTPDGVAISMIRLNEFLPHPSQIDWNGDGQLDSGDEWIEIVSLELTPIDLGGWMLDDIAGGGSKPYVFPAGTLLLPGSFVFRFGSTTGLALNNDGDTVRLLAPDGTEVDNYSYHASHPDRSFSRTVDGIGSWTETYPPSPGGANLPPTPTATPTTTFSPTPSATLTPTPTRTPSPTPTATPIGTATTTATPLPQGVMLNEFLPAPRAIDWNGDGQANYNDEWIELYNLNTAPVALDGWVIADATSVYTLPVGAMIWSHGYMMLYRSQTHRTLGDSRGAVSLLRPDGNSVDSFVYTQGPGSDLSYCRNGDGIGAWLRGCLPTPGEANRGLPPPAAEKPPSNDDLDTLAMRVASAAPVLSIAAARSAPEGMLTTVAGRVTMLPGPLGRRIYLEDETGGIQVYLRRGDFPSMALDDQVRATGWIAEFHGETQIEVSSAYRIAVAGHGVALPSRRLRTGEVGEAHEGRLVSIFGRVLRATKSNVTLDDGSGPAQIYFPADLPWQHPYVKLGELWGTQGVIGQYAAEAPYTDGYRLVPRLATDFSSAPLLLPVTGDD